MVLNRGPIIRAPGLINDGSEYSTPVQLPIKLKNGEEFRWYDVGDSHYVGLQAPALTASQIWTFPTTDGTNGQVLTTNGSGVMSWSAASYGDDVLLNLGTGNDIALVLRSTSLGADTTLANVLVDGGGIDHPGVAANSMIISNTTSGGDIMFAVNNGGDSHGALLIDASAKTVSIPLDDFEFRFGAGGDDLAIYHNGSDSIIEHNTAGTDLVIRHTVAGRKIVIDSSATGQVQIVGDLNPESDSAYDIGIQTTGQWANVWADLVNGADFAMANQWRMIEAELYEDYPAGWAIGHGGWEDGKSIWHNPEMIAGQKPVFAVTDDFIEFCGHRWTPQDFESRLARLESQIGGQK